MIDQKRFLVAKEKIVGKARERNGIGTLSEKTVHAVLKAYYAPDESSHEIPVGGCVADIFTGEEILEIQTRSFDRLREKLDRFLPLYPVTIVYPIPHEKRLIWIDGETGELSSPRKSPLTGNPYMAFRELYRIRKYLLRDGLRLRLVLLDMEEYRLLNGWSRDKKKGSTRFDRIPTRLVEEVCIDCPQDYMQFVPWDLEEPFTFREFAGKAHIRPAQAQLALPILMDTGAVERVGKKGNAWLYRVREG
ncbi:MAG TPA: hypothetical protein H9700_14540 [Candidatus Eisenbergiella intestinipullorum]|nr:hypothetical protein [Candidatus Eisenbergiella intestinipullorum]